MPQAGRRVLSAWGRRRTRGYLGICRVSLGLCYFCGHPVTRQTSPMRVSVTEGRRHQGTVATTVELTVHGQVKGERVRWRAGGGWVPHSAAQAEGHWLPVVAQDRPVA